MAAAWGETTMSGEHREIAMHRILRNWYGPGLALAVMTAGCATTPGSDVDVTFDYDTAANFAALKSYSWMPPAGNAASDELLVKRIKNSLDTQLQAKGRAPAEANPDF